MMAMRLADGAIAADEGAGEGRFADARRAGQADDMGDGRGVGGVEQGQRRRRFRLTLEGGERRGDGRACRLDRRESRLTQSGRFFPLPCFETGEGDPSRSDGG